MSTIIEVRPGNGGADAERFALELTNSIEAGLSRLGSKHERGAFSDRDRSFTVVSNVDPSAVG